MIEKGKGDYNYTGQEAPRFFIAALPNQECDKESRFFPTFIFKNRQQTQVTLNYYSYWSTGRRI